MIQLHNSILETLPSTARISNIKAFYTRNGRELFWTGHTAPVTVREFKYIKEDLTQGRPGLRWMGHIIN